MASRQSDVVLAGALARGAKQTEAALQAGLSERTVRRRLADPAFLKLLAREQEELGRLGRAQLAGLVSKAVQTIEEVLEDGPPHLRLRAAERIIDAATEHGKEERQRAELAYLFPPLF